MTKSASSRSDLASVDVKQSIPPAGNRTNGTVNGTGVDTSNHRRTLIVFNPATLTDGTQTPSVEESDTVGSGYTTVAAGDLTGTLAALASNTIQSVGYKGSKKYVRAVVVSAGTTTGGIFDAFVVGQKIRY